MINSITTTINDNNDNDNSIVPLRREWNWYLWRNGYRWRNWTHWDKFKPWTTLFTFYFALVPLEKAQNISS